MNVELRMWQVMPDQVKCADCDINALMPAQGSRIQHDELSVITTPPTPLENCRIREIQERRTLAGLGRAPDELLEPNIIRDNHVVGKTGAQTLNPEQCSES